MTRAVLKADEVASGTSTLTLLQAIAATNMPLRLVSWGVSFKGTNATAAPILVEIVRQTTAGTAGGAATWKKTNEDDGHTVQATGGQTFSVEPTTTDVLRSVEVHPQSGFTEAITDPDQFRVGGGNRLAIRVVTPGASVTATCYLEMDE